MLQPRVKSFLAGLIQMDSGPDKTINLALAQRLIDEAADNGAKLICLPEVWNQVGPIEPEDITGEAVNLLIQKAKQHKVYLHGGSILIKDESGKAKNTSLVIDPLGEIRARYDKIHLFDVTLPDGSTRNESNRISPGNKVVHVSTELGVFGLSICYDVRFSGLYRALANQGAEILFIPANFTLLTGKDQWEVLVRARAIETGCFVLAAGQFGRKRDNEDSFGGTMVVDPWGTVIARARNHEDVIITRINLADVTRVRRLLPTSLHQRPDIYHSTDT